MLVGIAFLALSGAWTWGLFANYDAAKGEVRLPLTGPTIQLGEAEGEERD